MGGWTFCLAGLVWVKFSSTIPHSLPVPFLVQAHCDQEPCDPNCLHVRCYLCPETFSAEGIYLLSLAFWLLCYVDLCIGGRVLVQHIPLTVQLCLLPCYLVTLVLPVGLGCLFLAVATRRRIRSTSRALHRREALSNALQWRLGTM